MSENLKTIRELADEFKVSKQAVRKRLTDEFRAKYVETVYSNGVATLVVTVAGYMLLKQHFSSGNESEKVGSDVGGNTSNIDATSDSKQTTDNSYVFKILEQQLAVKDKQIENKDSQISQMQNLLDQQQRLALQDKKLLEEYKQKIKELKSLEEPLSDKNEVDLINDREQIERLKAEVAFFKKELSKIAEQQEVKRHSKKWWHFFGG
ncbi:DNA-binding protein [Leuconostoc citreum]|uniref:DNA-binding protein n=1 Tax=Leuconostoc citreum TaxID=33964 RepID=UPI000A1E3FC4|nr:DNA-binding protein [Leuconostoc citreum]OSP81031.1 DNA-binding protein [Leuconostoc citreum]